MSKKVDWHYRASIPREVLREWHDRELEELRLRRYESVLEDLKQLKEENFQLKEENRLRAIVMQDLFQKSEEV